MSDKKFQKKLEKIKKQGERYKQEAEVREVYAQYAPEKKQRKVSNIMLIVIVLAIVGYVCANFWLQYHTGIAIDPTITGCWFGFWGAEIISLAAIKTSKVKHNTSDNSDNNSCG